MIATAKTTTSSNVLLRKAALIAGTGYLVVFILGLLTNFFIFGKLIVPGDAAKTADNIIANEPLFRLGIASWIIVLVFDSIVAWALYIFLTPVNKNLALLCAWFRLIYVAIFAASLVNLFSVLQVLTQADFLSTFSSSQAHSQAMLFLNAYNYGFISGIVFFAIHVLLLGYLILKSDDIPHFLGILLLIAAAGYLFNSFGNIISTDYAKHQSQFLLIVALPAIIAELAFTFWLLIKGGKSKPVGSGHFSME
ncbi:MAG TPA: DUF4386 domain-containing protein [Hanamia sp.]|nr:DUF4386 domain-containing protein [Hanamia sp.]